GAVIEIGHVQTKRPVFLDVDDVLANDVDVAGLAVRREAHQLVLARIDLEAGVISESRIQQPEGMRKIDLPERLQLAPVTEPCGRRRPFPDAVHAEDGRGLERARVERRSRMRLMVRREEQGRQLFPAYPA